MNISELAKAAQTTTDAIRYYEKQGLLGIPLRKDNGYRFYQQEDIRRVEFIRRAQTLGFSLREIKEVIPELLHGQLNRTDLEALLKNKIEQIDEKIKALNLLRKGLIDTFGLLKCSVDEPLSITQATP
ncbi:MAG: MerR family transcriptional regulator [Gammaproteobacteria bacterium]|nr:MerR family transcriptional regulator [Gammaproteobacteria bacterium]